MNLQSELKAALWQSIHKSYEAGNYSHAILESIHYLTNVVREKASIDGDGHQLVGQAFGGENPRIRINKFQTESEKSEQKGFAEILRGIYSGLRNPRAHESITDTQPAADAIILFVNYLLDVLESSKGPFVVEDWIERVFDADFVRSERYADLLVKEIPPRKRNDVVVTLYREKMRGPGENIKYIYSALMKCMIPDEQLNFYKLVSDELRIESNEELIMQVIRCLPRNTWSSLDEDARIRIENKLIRSIKRGFAIKDKNRNSVKVHNRFGSFATRILNEFTLIDELCTALINSFDSEERALYAVISFLPFLHEICRRAGFSDAESLLLQKLSLACSNYDSVNSYVSRNQQDLPGEWLEFIFGIIPSSYDDGTDDEDPPLVIH